jgi:predicted amidohydrolase
MGLAVVEGGNDYVIDSLRDPLKSYVPPKGRLVICFFESVKNPFMYVLTFPSFKRANTYFNCDSGPKGDTMWCDPGTRGGLKIPKKWPGCITATYSRFGKQTEPVVEGALAYWHNWYRDHPDRPIKKGEVYTCKWKPPYPGKWRMTVRIAEKKYDQGFKYDGKTKFPAKHFSRDVIISKKSTKGGKLTFRSPIDGWLDYSIIYMYDRTKETPKDILTPMDQYRWTIRQGKKNDKKTGQAPKALGGVLAGVCATGIKTTIDDVKSGKRADAVKKGFRVIKTSGSCSRITLSFNRDLNLKEAKRAENYQITPADVEQLQAVAVGKFVMLSGLKLKKSKKYIINISDAVKDTNGKAIAKVNRAVEYTPVYDKRKIRVSTVQPLRMDEWEKHYSTGDKGDAGYLKYVMGLVEEAGQMRSDIVCLPEAISITSRFKRSRYIPGPFFNTLAEKAKKHSMYIVAHMLEKEEKLLKAKGPKARRSTAFIIDRKGELLGKFRKVHLTEGESRRVVPGDTFPVFQTDFGKIGALICFDVIAYSESMRLLALNGAEIVFFPHATGRGCEKDIITRSRAMAMENGLYIVPSHYGRIISDDHGWFGRSSVIGPDGFIRADAGTDPGVASAVIDLEKKRLGYGWGTGGVNDIKQRIFKHRRPAIYGGLSEKKKPSSSSDKRGK